VSHRTIDRRRATIRLLVLTLAVPVALQACSGIGGARITAGSPPYTEGSGVKTTVQRSVGPYHGIDASVGVTVVVESGDPGAVSVTADDNLLDMLTTEVRDGTLYIGINGGLRTRNELKVQLANSRLDAIAASTGAAVTADSLSGSAITISAATGATVRGGGTADSVTVASTTGASVDLRELKAASVDAAVSTGATARVYPTQSVTGSSTGGSTLSIRGKPATNSVSTDISSTTKDGQ
jgi:hypothetical protein